MPSGLCSVTGKMRTPRSVAAPTMVNSVDGSPAGITWPVNVTVAFPRSTRHPAGADASVMRNPVGAVIRTWSMGLPKSAGTSTNSGADTPSLIVYTVAPGCAPAGSVDTISTAHNARMAPVIRPARILASVVTAVVMLLVTAAPAAAHTVSGQGATNIKSRLNSVTPTVPGLTVKLVELGSRIELTWTGPDDLIVYGYNNGSTRGEPYLRIGPEGVFHNRLSPATYINTTRFNPPAPPPDASNDPNTPPQWIKVSSGHTVLWHDHRTHFMGGPMPPEVRRQPGSYHVMQTFRIDMSEAARPIVVAGEYDWVPSHSAWPWVAILVVVAAVGVLAGLARSWAHLLAALTGLIVLADMVHAVGIGLAAAGSVGHRIVVILGGSYYSIVAWVLGAVAIRLLLRRSVDGLFATIFAALVIGLFGGLTDVGWLSHSQVPFDFGASLARLLVAVSIGGAAGVIAGSIIAFRRNRPRPVATSLVGQPATA